MILSDDQKRVLTFIREVNYGGHHPTTEEVELWFDHPSPKPGKTRTEVLPPLSPTLRKPDAHPHMSSYLPMRNVADTLAELRKQFDATLAPGGRYSDTWMQLAQLGSQLPRTRTIHEPGETVIEHLTRLRWISTNSTGTGLTLTALGRALLHAAEVSARDDLVILQDDGPIAWAELLKHISDAGECLIIDPYLRADQLQRFIEFGPVIRRVVVGPNLKEKEDLNPLRMLIAAQTDPPEVRIGTKDFMHDRFIVGETAVYTLGVSAPGVGEKITTLKRVEGGHAALLRNAFDRWWSESRPLVDGPGDDSTTRETT